MTANRPEFPIEKRERDRKAAEKDKQESERAEAARQMREQEIATSTSLLNAAKQLNCITAVAAFFAFLGAIGVVWSVLEAKSATVEANRAWLASLTPTWQIAPVKVGDQYQVEIIYENEGREPGLEVASIREEVDFDTSPLMDQTDLNSVQWTANNTCSDPDFQKNSGKSGTVWPTRAPDKFYHLYDSKGPRALSQEIFDNKKVLGFHGCIKYRTFNSEHKTAFCYFLNRKLNMPVKDWVWSPCPGQDQNFAD